MQSKIFIFLMAIFCVGSSLNALAKETTFSIVKPDSVSSNHIGDIIARYEKAGFRIAAMRMMRLTAAQAQYFYAEHQGKPFFPDLINFMTSGPCVVFVIEGDDVIQKNRILMGAEDKPGTVRGDFSTSKTKNAVHGSDSQESAKREINFFFPGIDLQERF